ncbi:hypothetical protein NPIL_68411 [Nephila pilipes]|uniref:Uncharacterized protein n=1 Tax=Nephila pilipes TaxID=299642 RepID=A0A8X6MFN5_NEPPI|nr:hypothetical protein NPIL_68411 [Nephila pilipes]
MWLPACLLGFLTGIAIFVAYNLTSEKSSREDCPKYLIRIMNYQFSEYFVHLDDKQVALLCKKSTVKPTEEVQVEDKATEYVKSKEMTTTEGQTSNLTTAATHAKGESIDEIKAFGEPSTKAPSPIEFIMDVKVVDKQIKKQIGKMQSTRSIFAPDFSQHLSYLTAPPVNFQVIPETKNSLQAIAEAKKAFQDIFESYSFEGKISEESGGTDYIIKEMLRSGGSIFTPYISPFIYLSLFLTEDIMRDISPVKPVNADLPYIEPTFIPYSSPLFYVHLLTAERQAASESIENADLDDQTIVNEQSATESSEDAQVDEQTIADEQVSTESLDNSNFQFERRLGLSSETKCSELSSALCHFNMDDDMIPTFRTLVEQTRFCEYLRSYYKCHFQNMITPKSLCGKRFSLNTAHELIMEICTGDSRQNYMKAVRCGRRVVREESERCLAESRSFAIEYKRKRGIESFEDETFERCLKGEFRKDCFSTAIEMECGADNFWEFDLLTKSGAREFLCKTREYFERATHAVEGVKLGFF